MKRLYSLFQRQPFIVIQCDASVVCPACLRPEDVVIETAKPKLTCDRCGKKRVRWERVSPLSYPKEQAVRVFQDALLTPFILGMPIERRLRVVHEPPTSNPEHTQESSTYCHHCEDWMAGRHISIGNHTTQDLLIHINDEHKSGFLPLAQWLSSKENSDG